MADQPVRILVLGASYGLLPGVKLGLAGHAVTFVGRAEEIAAMAPSDLEVRIPLRHADATVTLRLPVRQSASPGEAALRTPGEVDPESHDFFILAMQEPQFRAPDVAALMARIAATGRPCLSIMNLPPRPYLERIGGMDPAVFAGVYASDRVWQGFAPGKLSVASPDAQAMRRDPVHPGQLTVTLPSNFKAAPFADPHDQLLLERLASDISHVKVWHQGTSIRPPVSMLAKSSLFVPLAKWPMLLAGNCRCLVPGGIRSIAEAVLTDVDASRAIYDQVCGLLIAMGAPHRDLVGFDSYCKASQGLSLPSSLARGLSAGALAVERVDRLVANLMRWHGMASPAIDGIVAAIDHRLAGNIQASET